MSVPRAYKAKKKSSKAAKTNKEHSLAGYTNSPSKSADAWRATFGEILTQQGKVVAETVEKPQLKDLSLIEDISEGTSVEEARALEIDLSVSQKVGIEKELEIQPSAGSVSL